MLYLGILNVSPDYSPGRTMFDVLRNPFIHIRHYNIPAPISCQFLRVWSVNLSVVWTTLI